MKKTISKIAGGILIFLLIINGIKFVKKTYIEWHINKNYEPKYQVNDLYTSKELNYRLELDDDERKIYDLYMEKVLNFENNFTLDLSNYKYSYEYMYLNKMVDISNAVIYDHPELIYHGSVSFTINNNSKNVLVNISYIMDKDSYLKNVKLVKEQINYIKKNTVSLNDYEKTKYVYEYLGNKNNYGNINDSKAQSAFSAFDDTLSPVCAGYAKAAELIFNNIGINSLLIFGDLNSTWFVGDGHAWNVVKVNGRYYNFDVTQSSITKDSIGTINYYGFLNKDQTDLVADNKKIIPAIDGKKYDYYDYNNLSYKYKTNNLDKLKNILEKSNNKYVEVRISNSNKFIRDFDKIKDKLGVKHYKAINDIIILEKL